MNSTIKDVAKLAGVSFKTVSRVMNKEPSVGEALQEKVWAAAKTLNYQPNRSARLLRGTPSSIGFVYDNPNSHYIIELQHGILAECNKQGFELLIHPCDSTASTICEEVVAMVFRSQVAGLILTPPLSEMPAVIDALIAKNISFVRILSGSKAPDDLSPCIYIDDRSAAFTITEHLITLGHQQIGFLGGDIAHRSSIERLEGYKAALLAHGLTVDENLIVGGEYSFESGVERTKTLLHKAADTTAIFACNDEIAAGTLFAARLMGTAVPQQLSIVGFEDSPFSRQTWPKLTTAAQPNKVIAGQAAALLINATRPANKKDADIASRELGFHPQLVVRDSTCPPPA